MKWEELEYFFSLIKPEVSILDLACGSGRLLEQYFQYFSKYPLEYL
jgi:type I restriction-modification system DNA methylase subunit